MCVCIGDFIMSLHTGQLVGSPKQSKMLGTFSKQTVLVVSCIGLNNRVIQCILPCEYTILKNYIPCCGNTIIVLSMLHCIRMRG